MYDINKPSPSASASTSTGNHTLQLVSAAVTRSFRETNHHQLPPNREDNTQKSSVTSQQQPRLSSALPALGHFLCVLLIDKQGLTKPYAIHTPHTTHHKLPQPPKPPTTIWPSSLHPRPALPRPQAPSLLQVSSPALFFTPPNPRCALILTASRKGDSH